VTASFPLFFKHLLNEVLVSGFISFEVCTVVRIKIVVLQIMMSRTLQGGCKCSEESSAPVGLHHAGD
jgi:hypothetical protein